MILTRRSFFGLLAAPAIVRFASIMPIAALRKPPPDLVSWTIPLGPEDVANQAQEIEAYQQAMTKWLDMGFGPGDLPAQMLRGFDPGGKPGDLWMPRAGTVTRYECAALVAIGPDWGDA
jgi:hypothetical protein